MHPCNRTPVVIVQEDRAVGLSVSHHHARGVDLLCTNGPDDVETLNLYVCSLDCALIDLSHLMVWFVTAPANRLLKSLVDSIPNQRTVGLGNS